MMIHALNVTSFLFVGNVHEMVPLTQIPNSILYKGFENQFLLYKIYKINPICDFDMTMYPFDVQTCFAEFMIPSDQQTSVKLVKGGLVNKATAYAASYYLGDVFFEEFLRNKDTGVSISPLPHLWL